VLGRPIRAFEIGDPKSPRKVLVVGCIHGNEPAGIAVARALEHRRPPPHVDLWVIDDLNPDGVAANTRQNADGVDLNRNFPFGWRRIGRPGSLYYSGPRPLSEPESRIAWRLIVEIRPRITIWYHQHEGVVDTSGGDKAPEARYAHLVGLPLVRLTRYPGSATTWQDHRFPRAAAFVVELPPGSLDATQADRFAAAVVALGQGS
jgi:protein MpaA